MLRFCKPVHQNGSPKPFCKAAPEICASKLLPKAAVQSYCPKATILQINTLKCLPKAILQSGSRKLLPKVATESCSPKRFVYRQIVILVVINWRLAVIDCGLQFLGHNSEQPCGLHRGHRHRINMTKCVTIWKYATGLVVYLHSASLATLYQRPFSNAKSAAPKRHSYPRPASLKYLWAL